MHGSDRILSFDISSTIGWAFGPANGHPTHYGSHRLAVANAPLEQLFSAGLLWFNERIEKFNPDWVVFEAPLASNFTAGRTTSRNIEILNGLPAILQAVAFTRGVPKIRRAAADDVREHFLGYRRLSKKDFPDANQRRNELKRRIVAKCRELGWKPDDDNCADALSIWSFARAFIAPKHAVDPMPLFMPGPRRALAEDADDADDMDSVSTLELGRDGR